MQSVPLDERPRERLLRYGSRSLALHELIAILLVTGTKEKSVLILAQELTLKFGGIQGLLEASVQELQQVKGIGEAKAIQLKAAFAIAEKAVKVSVTSRTHIHTPLEAFELAREEIATQKQEMLLVLLRDVRGRLIHFEKVSIGTLSEVLVHPREVFYPAVKHKAHSFILAHNHPSGDPTPSECDLQLTKLLMHSSRVMGIGLDDHLIVSENSFVSLRERGILDKKPLSTY